MVLGGIAALSAGAAVAVCALTGAFSGLACLWILPLSFVAGFLVLAAAAFLFLWIMCARVDLSKPQTRDSRFYRGLVYQCVDVVLPLLQMRVHTRGLEKTPREGRVLLVCNHIHDLDPVTLLGFFRKSQLAFITKRENMSMFLVGKLMHKILCQPLNRENDREALKTIIKCVELIKEDLASVAVFPEGYTSRDGLFHRFRSGVFKIAQKTKVPIVVCTIQNTNKVFHNALRLKSTDIHLHLVEVLQPGDYEGMTAVQIGEKVHKLMADDLGPELVAAE
jgi:1-acyl-sn-glycerol-3-phosphate acyltransferase